MQEITVNIFVYLVVHFMKWSVDFSSISRNGQIFFFHFTKWTISHLGHKIYIPSVCHLFRANMVCGGQKKILILPGMDIPFHIKVNTCTLLGKSECGIRFQNAGDSHLHTYTYTSAKSNKPFKMCSMWRIFHGDLEEIWHGM